ncbi:hypothetical protein IKG07_01480 [Candidatus Saccharibacteria bacterium]|nr:hypothetical protein [Candidatus Saccharibacteria bacterium]
MLRHLHLIDPVERTKDMDVTEFTKYTDIRKAQVGPTDPNVVQMIMREFYDKHLRRGNQEELDKIWEFMCPKIEENAGLAQFILDYDGAGSDYFFPWLINIFRSPSLALEMSYGAGTDLDGKWVEKVPKEDPIDFFVRNDPTFVYNRERQRYVADLVTTVQDEDFGCSEHFSKVVDLGAGRLAWARWHNFQFEPEHQAILAFDKDPSIKPEELFPGRDLKDLGLTFKHGDLMVQVNNVDCRDANLIILGGVKSYIRDDVFAQAVMMPVYHLLAPGGVFYFDLQVDCPYLRRSMSIFDWPNMYLPESIGDAIGGIESMRKDFWQKGLRFSAEYAVDTYNESPTAIMVNLQKV